MYKPGRPLTQLTNLRPEYIRGFSRLWLTTVEEVAGIIRLPEIESSVSLEKVVALFADEFSISPNVAYKEILQVVRNSIHDTEWYAMAALEEPLSFGLLTEEADQMYSLQAPGASAATSEELSRRINLLETSQDCFHDVGNQNPRGTCVAFAVTALHEYIHSQIQGRKTPHLSEEFLYWAARKEQYNREPGTCHQCGTFLQDALQAVLRLGQCRAETRPYRTHLPCNLEFAQEDEIDPGFVCRSECIYGNNHSYSAKGALDASIEADAAAFRLEGWESSRLFTVQDIKRALHSGYPVVVGIACYASWLSPVSRHSGVITIPFQLEIDDHQYHLGWHAMLVVGYEDDELDTISATPARGSTTPGGGYFVLRNSWGKHWGDRSPTGYPAGYGMMPYAYLNRQSFYAYTLKQKQ